MEERNIEPHNHLHVTKYDAAIVLGVLKDIRQLLEQILEKTRR